MAVVGMGLAMGLLSCWWVQEGCPGWAGCCNLRLLRHHLVVQLQPKHAATGVTIHTLLVGVAATGLVPLRCAGPQPS